MNEATGPAPADGPHDQPYPGAPPPAEMPWPPGMPSEGDAIAVVCRACGQPWRVHPSMAGFRLRCRCSGWVEVPAAAPLASPASLPIPRPDEAATALPAIASALPTDERGLVSVPAEPGVVVFAPIATDLPLAPGALLQASDSNRARWTTRTVLEFVAMMAALFLPQLAAMLLAKGREFVLLLPLADLVSGALLLVALAFAGPYARMGFGGAKAKHWAEAALMTGPFLLLAHLWMHLLQQAFPGAVDPLAGMREQLGVVASLFVVAVSPAVLEEIIFRGALQGRLLALLGERIGLVVTAMAFALCHQAPAVLVVHVSIGLYLGWLRQRCGSLLPGMLLHFLYNGSLVLLS